MPSVKDIGPKILEMKRILKRLGWGVLALVAVAFVASWLWLRHSKPQHTGSVKMNGLSAPVDAYFDEEGIPHVYAQNKFDLYRVFGYLHAQDRLFQMEMLRRAGSGRLAEIIGKPLLKVDKMFRTIGLPDYARQSASILEKDTTGTLQEVQAYLEGVNTFLDEGPTPPEFALIGIPKEHFSLYDLYCITGAMSFSFSQAQKTDPVLHYVRTALSMQHLKDLAVFHDSLESYIPAYPDGGPLSSADAVNMVNMIAEIEEALPYQPLLGSNSWVVGGSKSESKLPIFCNDTHIGYMLPQTWYEAHLACPGFEIYGHFLAGVPFALVGRNRAMSWGLTMLLNDDMDFYSEKIDNGRVTIGDTQVPLQERTEIIKIKGEKDTTILVRTTPHGPLVSDVFDGFTQPVSMKWSYTLIPNRTVHAFRGMNGATNLGEFKRHLSSIHGPGLNITYADTAGNIAWWACAALVDRPDSTLSLTFLDGSSGREEWRGYIPFEKNPRSINPPSGFVYSANDWPDTIDGKWYPGYYKPQYRADRIRKLLEPKNDWNTESMRSVMTDHISDADAKVMKMMAMIFAAEQGPVHGRFEVYKDLFMWDGSYTPSSVSATLFNTVLYYYLEGALKDELGDELFGLFLSTHQVQRAQVYLMQQSDSPWWDDVSTTNVKETRKQILAAAFMKATDLLREEFGDNPVNWEWREVCSLEFKHPLGEVALLKPLVNRGPYEVYGGNETILQSGFKMDSTGLFKVFFGSQMRIIADMAYPEDGVSITPAGQSGHLLSGFYNNQSERYVQLEFRPQLLNEREIRKKIPLHFEPR